MNKQVYILANRFHKNEQNTSLEKIRLYCISGNFPW